MQESRYDRQERFAPLGSAGQAKLRAARVLIVGVGALGSVTAELLARAGVGHLRLVDRDTVELSNLQRQALYTESDAAAGLAKVQAAANHLAGINSEVTVEPLALDVTSGNLLALVDDIDLILDGTDNFETRFLLNDVALEKRLPWVHAGCVGAAGQVFTFWPGKTICLRCLVPQSPAAGTTATCDTAGVLGPATHLVAATQAVEALRALVLGPAAIRSTVLTLDAWEGRWRQFETIDLQNSVCPACQLGQRDFLRGAGGGAQPTVLCGRGAVQIPAKPGGTELDLSERASTWSGLGEVDQNRFLVRLRLDAQRSITLFRDGRAVITGTEDISVAKSLYARFVGN